MEATFMKEGRPRPTEWLFLLFLTLSLTTLPKRERERRRKKEGAEISWEIDDGRRRLYRMSEDGGVIQQKTSQTTHTDYRMELQGDQGG